MRVRQSLELLFCPPFSPLLRSRRTGSSRWIDAWVTTDDGSTYVDFAKTPIPAVLLLRVASFTAGRIPGEPVVTGTPGALGATIRSFSAWTMRSSPSGGAVTRISVPRLVAQSRIDRDRVREVHRHRQTRWRSAHHAMRIMRESKNGGQFIAPLSQCETELQAGGPW